MRTFPNFSATQWGEKSTPDHIVTYYQENTATVKLRLELTGERNRNWCGSRLASRPDDVGAGQSNGGNCVKHGSHCSSVAYLLFPSLSGAYVPAAPGAGRGRGRGRANNGGESEK